MMGPSGAIFFLWLPLLLGLVVWLHLALHKLGHAVGAWAVGYRYRLRFDWTGLVRDGGYSSVPPRDLRDVRLKQSLVVAAGLLTSLAAAGALALAVLEVRGTWLAPFWIAFAIGSAVGFVVIGLNLVPSGCSDGNMLMHLILHTRRGDELIALVLSGRLGQNAHDRRRAGDHEGALALHRRALQRLQEGKKRDPIGLALAYSHLGLSELAAGSRRAAEANLRAGLDLLAGNAREPGIAVNCWAGLHRIFRLEHRAGEADEAYRAALDALGKLHDHPPRGMSTAMIEGSITELHAAAGEFEAALATIARALARLDDGRKQLRLRGMLLRHRVQCELELGRPDVGLAAAQEAATVLRSCDESERELSVAPEELGMLGLELWLGGQTGAAIPILTECIQAFEALGEQNPADRFRLSLANVLRLEDRLEEAEAALSRPSPDERLSQQFLETRADIHCSEGRFSEAVAGYLELLRRKEQDPDVPDFELAAVHSWLAEAYLSAGRLEEAEPMAQGAWETLTAAKSPEASHAAITLALVAKQRGRPAAEWIEGGLRAIEDARLLRHAEKARFLERSARRLESGGLPDEAARCQLAAQAHWKALGLRKADSETSSTAG